MDLQRLLGLFEKLEGLIGRLPAGLQKPILREIVPVKEIFLQQRPPRIAVAGPEDLPAAALAAELFALPVESPVLAEGWAEYSAQHKGRLEILDTRPFTPEFSRAAEAAVTEKQPDLFLFLCPAAKAGADHGAEFERLAGLCLMAESRHGSTPVVLGVLANGPPPSEGASAPDHEQARLALHAQLLRHPGLRGMVKDTVRLQGGATSFAHKLWGHLPVPSRLEMARVTGDRDCQRELCTNLIRASTGVCAAIGAQPIPLADFPLLTAIQLTMVAAIMHVSGRDLSTKAAGEFVGALGANVGIALVFREGARALLKFVPGWGNAVSGFVAGAGTFAVGKAAVGYFIDGLGIDAARSIFRRIKREKSKDTKRLESNR